MLVSIILLSLGVSIDSLGIGLTYGLKSTKITFGAKVILFMISITTITTFMVFGNYISKILPSYLSKLLGCLFLLGMGVWMMLNAIIDKNKNKNKITLQIIKNPYLSDIDHSNNIDAKEAIYLGLALSLDSIGVGFNSSIIGLYSLLFPLLSSVFHILFLLIGSNLGKKIKDISNIPENIWSIISASLLIFISISKLFL